MSSWKYLAAIAATAILIGAIWISLNGRSSIAPSLSGSLRENQRSSRPLERDDGAGKEKPISVEPTSVSPQDLQRLKVLDEILISRNDNDPRLDTEFRGLSPMLKKLMEERYQSLAHEKRNARGTIVFLLGREIGSAEDVAFLESVVSEEPCLSLGDCSREEKSIDDDHLHAASGENVTLAYPQLVALRAAEAQIEKAEKGEKMIYLKELSQVGDRASRSPVPIIADHGRALLSRIKEVSQRIFQSGSQSI